MKIISKKFILYTFSTLFVVGVLLFTLSYFFLDDYVDARLQKLISKKFGTFYSLSYDSIEKDISMTEISFIVNNAVFSSDTTDKEGMEKFPVFFFETKQLKVENISTWNVLIGSSLNLDNILLEKPNLRVYTQPKGAGKASEVKNIKGKPVLSGLSIEHFLLSDGNVEFIDFQNKTTTFISNSILVDVNEISLDLTQLNDYKHFLSFNDVIIESKTPKFTPLEGFYNYDMESMSLSSEDKNLSFKNININTKQSLKEASKQVVNHKELVNVNVETINITDVDLKKIIFETTVEIGKIDVEKSYIHVFKNNHKRLDANFEKHVFGEMIRSIPIPVKVDTIQLHQVDVDYELLNSAHSTPAKLNFNIHDGYIANFHNNLHSSDTLHFFAEGEFMKQGSIWITARILVSDTINDYQSYKGSIKSMPFKTLNPLVKQFFNASIASGYINEVSFHGTANKHSTNGGVIFKYTDLKINFFKKKDHHKRFFLLSEIANASTHKNNPDKHGRLVGSNFHYQRKKWQGSIGMWLGGIINGMLNVAVKELPKEVLEKEQEFKSSHKNGLFHHDKKKKEKQPKEKKEKKKLFHLRKKEKKNHDGLHLFHKKNKKEKEPKEKKKLFHHNKNKEEEETP